MKTAALLTVSLIVAAACLGARLAAVPLLEERGQVVPVSIPGGIIDQRAGRAYVTAPEGKVAVLDLDTGRQLLLSTGKGLGTPLLVHGQHLFVQATVLLAVPQNDLFPNQLRIVCLDLAEGGKAVWDVTLPAWYAQEAGNFRTAARLERGRLIVEWERRGLERGAFQIDARTGHSFAIPRPASARPEDLLKQHVLDERFWWVREATETVGDTVYEAVRQDLQLDVATMTQVETIVLQVSAGDTGKRKWQHVLARKASLFQW